MDAKSGGADFKGLSRAAVASWLLTSLAGAIVHVPILVILSPAVWLAALVAYGVFFWLLPEAQPGGRTQRAAVLAALFLGALGLLASSLYSGSAFGEAIDAARKSRDGIAVYANQSHPIAAVVWVVAASGVFAGAVWLRTRWPAARISAIGGAGVLLVAGIALMQSLLPLNA